MVETVIFIGTSISLILVGSAFLPAGRIEKRRNIRRIMVRAKGVEIFRNKIGEN